MVIGPGRLASLVAALTAVALLVASAGAGAKSHCAARPSSDPLAPQLMFPCTATRLRAGHSFVWQVKDTDPMAAQPLYRPWLDLTRKRGRHGILPRDETGYGIYAPLKPVKNRAGRFSYKAPVYHFGGYWLVSRGTWYAQVQQIDGTGGGAIHYSRVVRLVIR
ncbi:MAG TPA: hypothetical protein VGL51_12880 [Solirubrobacteraceae bacterium]|jgi:hypothetical protein